MDQDHAQLQHLVNRRAADVLIVALAVLPRVREAEPLLLVRRQAPALVGRDVRAAVVPDLQVQLGARPWPRSSARLARAVIDRVVCPRVSAGYASDVRK